MDDKEINMETLCRNNGLGVGKKQEINPSVSRWAKIKLTLVTRPLLTQPHVEVRGRADARPFRTLESSRR